MPRIDNSWARANVNLPWPPPDSDNEQSRTIPFKVWDLDDVYRVAKACLETNSDNLIVSVTEDCGRNLQALEWEAKDVAEKLLLLPKADYQNSQWCKRSAQSGVVQKPAMQWLPCDSYVLKTLDQTKSGWTGIVEYYFKLCLSPTRKLILMVSVHT